MKKGWRLLTPWFMWELPSFLFYCFQKCRIAVSFFQVHAVLIFPTKNTNMTLTSKVGNVEREETNFLLDLPELALECIFERLSPTELCSMAGVCSYLREMCSSDHLWEKHMKLKWGRVIGDAAYKEWQWHIASRWRPRLLNTNGQKGLFQYLFGFWPFSWIKPEFGSNKKPRNSLPADSLMALYVSLEKGQFWFPAQVYNRENGHVGFMLSCYDALLCYDFRTDSFQARYSPHGRRTIEENIHWDRLRAAPLDTPSHVLLVSDCLHDLKPGDHIEIQWRRNKEFPYGWWYAVVGHLESCDGNINYCHCHENDSIMLEFNQFNSGSRWRRTIVNRNEHREEGNEADGFYGGIRKLYKEEEISMWKSLWPTKVLE